MLEGQSSAIGALQVARRDRATLLASVRATLPAELRERVVSASRRGEVLTLGAHSAAWANRLRYVACDLRDALNGAGEVGITRVRVRVILSKSNDT